MLLFEGFSNMNLYVGALVQSLGVYVSELTPKNEKKKIGGQTIVQTTETPILSIPEKVAYSVLESELSR
ncbi:hypothetical protein AgCh_031090 [Apium graveolens]